jgi:hypothetical protein
LFHTVIISYYSEPDVETESHVPESYPPNVTISAPEKNSSAETFTLPD